MPNRTEKHISQLRPATTTAATLYSPGDNVTAVVRTIYVCNTTGNSHDFRIFLDDNGTTYDETTALYFDQALAANTTLKIETSIPMNNDSGYVAVGTDTNYAFRL